MKIKRRGKRGDRLRSTCLSHPEKNVVLDAAAQGKALKLILSQMSKEGSQIHSRQVRKST